MALLVNQSETSAEDRRIRAALNEHVRDAIRPATLGAACLFALFSISHVFLLPSSVQPVMVTLSTSTMLAYLVMHMYAVRRTVPLRWVHPFACVGLAMPILNVLVHMYLLHDSYQSINIALIVIGAGILLLSSWWWLVIVATTLLSWLAVVVALSLDVYSQEWISFGYLLIVAAVLSTIAHVGRLRALRRVEHLHFREIERQHELEHALEALQKSEARLQVAQVELEQRVAAQTAELELANAELYREIAERRRTETDTQFLASASATISGSLEYTETLESVVQHAVPYLADYCIIDMVENGQHHQAAVAHVIPEKIQLLRELRREAPLNLGDTFGPAKVLREGRPELVPAVQAATLSERVTSNPEYARLLHELQPFSYIIVPLVVGNTTIGAMSLVSSESRRTYEHRHLHLASALAHRAALALEHARLYKRANQAIVARDAFVSIAAHELKSPLTALSGYAQLLYDRANASPTADAFQRRALQTILTQSKRLEHLIGTMLDVSLIENDQLALDLGPVCIPDLVQQVVESQRMFVDMHQIEIEVKAAQPPYVLGDASRLEQLFQNLIQNAVKYSPNGGRVHVTVEATDQQVAIAVADTGIGIAADDIPRLFQRFYRASSAEHSHIKGMGIGLYVVREIVERHGGTIEIESVEWEGSVFRVRLPVHSSTQAA